MTGAVVNGSTAGAEQVAWNLIRGKPWAEGLGESIVNGMVVGHIFEKHGNQMAARGAAKAPETLALRLPSERANVEPAWTISKVDIGEGTVDWPEVCKALGEINFHGWVTAEVGGGDRARLKKIKEQMDQVFSG